MLRHRPDLRVTWITGSRATWQRMRDQGLPVAMRWSPAGLIAAARARVYAFGHDPDDVSPVLSPGALLLNLWHGVGLKALHAGRKEARGARAWLQSFVYRPYDTVVTTSDMMQRHFTEQFRLSPDRCPQLGYPRLDCSSDPVLAETARAPDRAGDFALRPDGFDEAYIYLPTFRDTGRPFLAEALPDPARLSAVLAGRNAILWVKPHGRTIETFPTGFANIRRWPDAVDFNTYLGDLTGLITDYSSVLYDYLFVRDSGAILYTFDLADYLARDRALLYPFADNVAGLQVDSFAALCDALAGGSALAPTPGRDAIVARFWGGSARPASPAVVAYVEARLGTDRRV